MLLSSNESKFVKIEGRNYLYFGGTNYLGLAHREELLAIVRSSFVDFGFSSGASRLTSGENDIIIALEHELAEFCRAESSVTLPAGFMANQAILEAVDPEVDCWLVSRRAHSSIHSAVQHTRKSVLYAEPEQLFDDSQALRKRFAIPESTRIGIFAEPIDALSGNVNAIEVLIKQIRGGDHVILDEAQSIGVLGENGRGAIEHFASFTSENVLRTGTFSKAFGTYGGFVLGPKRTIDLIKANSSGYRGSTSLPPLLCAASRESVRIIKADPESTVTKLHKNIEALNCMIQDSSTLRSNLQLATSTIDGAERKRQLTPIYYLLGADDVSLIRSTLLRDSIYVPSMSNYFNGAKESGFRFTIQSGHTFDDLAMIVRSIESVFLQ